MITALTIVLFILLFLVPFLPIDKRIKAPIYFLLLIFITASVFGNISEEVGSMPTSTTSIGITPTHSQPFNGFVVPVNGRITAVMMTIHQHFGTSSVESSWYIVNVSNGTATMTEETTTFDMGNAKSNDLAVLTLQRSTLTYLGISNYYGTDFPITFATTFINNLGNDVLIYITYIRVDFDSYSVVKER